MLSKSELVDSHHVTCYLQLKSHGNLSSVKSWWLMQRPRLSLVAIFLLFCGPWATLSWCKHYGYWSVRNLFSEHSVIRNIMKIRHLNFVVFWALVPLWYQYAMDNISLSGQLVWLILRVPFDEDGFSILSVWKFRDS